MVARYPRSHRVVDWVLEFIYGLMADPAIALAVSLLLVSFVISDYIPVIVWVSVELAWFICVIKIARNEKIKELSVITRFIVVSSIALLLFAASKPYVRWSLAKYYARSEKQSATPNVTPTDPDRFWDRISNLAQQEMKKTAKESSPRTKTATKPTASVQGVASSALAIANELTTIGHIWYREDDTTITRYSVAMGTTSDPSKRAQLQTERDNSRSALKDKYLTELAVPLMLSAETIRVQLLNEVPDSDQTAEDSNEAVIFATILAGHSVPPASVEGAGNYLRALLKRVSVTTH